MAAGERTEDPEKAGEPGPAESTSPAPTTRFFYQRSHGLQRVALGLFCLLPFLVHGQGPFALALALWLSLVVGALLVIFGMTTKWGDGVSVDARGVRLGDRLIERGRIDAAYIVPASAKVPLRVCVVADHGRVRAWFHATQPVAEQVLGELALGGARVRGRRIGRGDPRGLVDTTIIVALVGLFGLAIAWWVPLLVTVLAFSIRAFLGRTDVTIGRDGIAFRSHLESMHVAWSEVVAIEPLPRGFFVRKRTGNALTFFTVPNRLLASETEREERASFVERATALHAASEKEGDVTAIVSAALAQEGPFRDASVRREDLWRVVESGSASPELRVKAARLLAADATPEERTRFRLTAEWCAEPKVRVSLDALAEATDEPATHGARRQDV